MDRFLELLEAGLEERLEGSGMSPLVCEGENAYVTMIMLPNEFVITYQVDKDDYVLKKTFDALAPVIKFKEMYCDGALDVNIYDVFTKMPGVIQFVNPHGNPKILRLLGTVLQQTYGVHNIFSIHFEEDCIRVNTRGGRFYFKYDDFNVNLKKEMELMSMTMRKPIRKRKI